MKKLFTNNGPIKVWNTAVGKSELYYCLSYSFFKEEHVISILYKENYLYFAEILKESNYLNFRLYPLTKLKLNKFDNKIDELRNKLVDTMSYDIKEYVYVDDRYYKTDNWNPLDNYKLISIKSPSLTIIGIVIKTLETKITKSFDQGDVNYSFENSKVVLYRTDGIISVWDIDYLIIDKNIRTMISAKEEKFLYEVPNYCWDKYLDPNNNIEEFEISYLKPLTDIVYSVDYISCRLINLCKDSIKEYYNLMGKLRITQLIELDSKSKKILDHFDKFKDKTEDLLSNEDF